MIEFHLFTDLTVIWSPLGIGKRQNNSVIHQFKFSSNTITNLRTLDKQEVWQSVVSPSIELNLQQKVKKMGEVINKRCKIKFCCITKLHLADSIRSYWGDSFGVGEVASYHLKIGCSACHSLDPLD